jgi:imidazolonepropionase-like amidohydrolase
MSPHHPLVALATSVLALAAIRSLPVNAQAPRPAVVAITGGTVLTITQGTIPRGVVLIRGGTIAAVGANVSVPEGAEIVDATGKFVTPGLIDAHSHIAVDAINEGGTAVSSMTGTADVLDPTDINIYRDLAGGTTTANVLHGSANPIGGKNVVIKLRWGKARAEELIFDGALPGIKLALGENVKQVRLTGQAPRRYPITRAGVEFTIRDAFTRAKTYQAEWRDYERRKKAGEKPLVPRRDLQLEPLVEILDGKRLVHAHCYRSDEILMLLRLAEEIGFKITTLQHVLEGYKVAKEIAAHGAGASTFSDWWGYKVEAMDATPYNAALMVRRGVLVSINSDSAEHARRLNTEAAKSIKWGGLSEDEALALVTINPARQLKIDTRVGSLDTGKDADVTIWNRHPLSGYAIVDRTYIDGTLYYDRANEDARVADLKRKKEELLKIEQSDKERNEKKPTLTTAVEAGGGDLMEATAATGVRGAGAAAQASRAQAASGLVLAITNARIHPVSQPAIERGTVLVRDGLIVAVGASVTPPAGAQILDVAGADVYPGWVAGSSTLGLAEPGPAGLADTSEMLEFNPHLRTIVSFNPDSEAIPVARANGITTAAIVPSGGLFGGQVPMVSLDGWTWEDATVKPYVAQALQFPSLTPTVSFSGGGAPPDRDRTYEDLKKERDRKLESVSHLLAQARAYAKTQPGSRTVDWALEALVPVVEGRVPLLVSANREADIREAVAFAGRENLRLVLYGSTEIALVADLLKERNIPVILGPVLTLPTRDDMHHAASYRAAGELARAGVKFAFTTGNDSANVRQLPWHAAESVAWGLDRDRAIRALTIDAAEILGVADQVGSLEQGKRANLIVAAGDPLEIRTAIKYVFINGRDVGLANRHLTLYERYSKRP